MGESCRKETSGLIFLRPHERSHLESCVKRKVRKSKSNDGTPPMS